MVCAEIGERLSAFALWSRVFTCDEFLDSADSDVDPSALRDALLSDERYVRLADDTWGDQLFVPARTLFLWLGAVTFRLAKARQGSLAEAQLRALMRSLRPQDGWNAVPAEVIEFGHRFGLIGRAWAPGRYVLPLAHVLSFVPPAHIAAAATVLDDFANREKLEAPPDREALHSLHEGLSMLDHKSRCVLWLRGGLSGGERPTLEEIGKAMDVTRERVRQIEKKSWDKVKGARSAAQFVAALLYLVMHQRGSLIIDDNSPDSRLKAFMAKCISVPVGIVPGSGLAVLGVSSQGLEQLLQGRGRIPEDSEPNVVAERLSRADGVCLIASDLEKLAKAVASCRRAATTRKHERVYLALRACGKPAHYGQVTRVYNAMFPETPSNEHSIHAILGRESDGIVWVGMKGTYALKEWGYERPSQGLFELATEIVSQKFTETGRPVPHEVVVAEIGRHRPVVNPVSLIFVTGANPRLQKVGDNCYVPRALDQAEPELSDEEIDRVIRELEGRLGGQAAAG